MADLPDKLDRYQAPLPYEVLGVTPDADARQIRDRHNEMQRDLQEKGMDASERAKEAQRLQEAYDQLRTAGNRMRIDFFLLDPNLGHKQCEAVAEELAKPDTQVEGILKPRTFQVSHETILGELNTFVLAPPKVVGLHPRRMELEELELPEPLAVQFDC